MASGWSTAVRLSWFFTLANDKRREGQWIVDFSLRDF